MTTFNKIKKYIFRNPWDLWGLIFLIPGLLFFGGVFLYPAIQTIFLSFTKYNIFTPPQPIGLDNYKFLLSTSPVFLRSVKATAWYVAFQTFGSLGLSFLTAYILMQLPKVRDICRALFFTPVILPWVVVAAVWKLIYTPPGPIDAFLGLFGGSYNISLLNQPSTAMWAVILTSVWKNFGFFVILFIAALNSIPEELYEASAVDGATPGVQFRRITLPLMKSISLFIVVMNFLQAIKGFDPFQVMTDGGGPARATYHITLFIYETAFRYMRMGQASAISMMMFLVIVVFTVIQFRLFSD